MEPKSECFYYDAHNDVVVPLLAWLNAVGWASEYSGGSQHPGTIQQFAPEYFTTLWARLKHMCLQPALDTIPLFYNMKPSTDNVLIKPIPPVEKTPGGVIIPQSILKTGLRGTVVGVGPGKYNPATGGTHPMEAKEGQTVMYDRYAGTELTLEGEKHLIMPEKAILLYL